MVTFKIMIVQMFYVIKFLISLLLVMNYCCITFGMVMKFMKRSHVHFGEFFLSWLLFFIYCMIKVAWSRDLLIFRVGKVLICIQTIKDQIFILPIFDRKLIDTGLKSPPKIQFLVRILTNNQSFKPKIICSIYPILS